MPDMTFSFVYFGVKNTVVFISVSVEVLDEFQDMFVICLVKLIRDDLKQPGLAGRDPDADANARNRYFLLDADANA